ncbi:MAG: hydrogenase expression/formation protein HypE [Planctomycetes bacterium]|nr:hydrogenase expression/formation protein HypE [Planctomycetota bacterium]MCG2684130.1 hydrogenase expression/formation protein HypE [Planctomycetales bacterium]
MNDEFKLNCPVPIGDHATVQLAHGGGGRMMKNLIEGLFLPAFGAGQLAAEAANPAPPHDAAVLPVAGGTGLASGTRLAFTTDSFVVNPLFFPGGDIGELAVYGTVNDLAMAGAKPAWLSAGFILEEGFSLDSLRRIVESMAAAARAAGVRIVTGDTKVVDRGKADGVFINTSGIGWVPEGVEISPERVQPGDVILLSGDLGRHGMAVMSVREGLRFESDLESDCAPLAGLVEAMLAAGTAEVHCLRDLTRGGLAAALNEIASDARVGVEIDESAVPVTEPVASACELLGLDPLYVANEGRLVAFVSPASADRVLAAMHAHPAAITPARIGVVTSSHAGLVELCGPFGPGRILDLLSGEQMPRIC